MLSEKIPLSYKAWVSPEPRAAFLLVHGLGSNPAWWEPFAGGLLKKGFSSYAIDLRPYVSFDEFFAAVRETLQKIRKDNPGLKVFSVGESMGSLIIFSMALRDKAIFDGIACMTPAFYSKAPLKIPDYFKIFLPLLYDPKKQYKLPVSSDMCTRDPTYLKMIESTYDKDVLSTSRVLFDIFIVQLRSRLLRQRIDMPLLFLVAGDDKLVDSESSKKVFKRLIAKDKSMIEYPDMYHSLSIDIGKEKVFQDILNWAERRM